MADTTHPNPKRRRAEAAQYLRDQHGIPYTDKTLANRAAAGLRPKPVYLGTIPYYTETELDDYAATAFTPESPVAVTRRKAAALAAQDLRNQPRTTRRRARPEPATA
jgi:hypothetical protein